MHLTLPDGRLLDLSRPLIVGVLNLTPDSFSDGGAYPNTAKAVASALRMIAQGAAVIDIGGESTRPGAERVPVREQIGRVQEVIETLRQRTRVPISIDTTRHTVAKAAFEAGASIINDVSAGRDDDDRLFLLAAREGMPIILTHMLDQPATMQAEPTYEDVVAEVRQFLVDRAAAAQVAGVPRSQIVLDPGIGFGKTIDHNLTLLAHLDTFVSTGYPVMLGTSRKRFLGEITGTNEPTERDPATAATSALAAEAGVHMVRVHDVLTNRHAVDIAYAVRRARRAFTASS
ncbi:MAG: dihydropteroate synthase [Phycisphaeraceae bacterium]